MNEASPAARAAAVHVIDDDAAVRLSLVDLLTASGWTARPFADPHQFLAALDGLEPGVLLIDMRLDGTTGIDLLAELAARDCLWPAAIITAHGAIPLAVEAVRRGAFDFIEKPFSAARLREVVEAGARMLPEAAERSRRRKATRQLIDALSPRQRQVFEGVVSGLTSKQIALRHGLSHRTVEAYRLDMVAKLGVQNAADLFELKAVLADLGEPIG